MKGAGSGRPNSGEVACRRRGPRVQEDSVSHAAPVDGLGGAWDGRNSAIHDEQRGGGRDER